MAFHWKDDWTFTRDAANNVQISNVPWEIHLCLKSAEWDSIVASVNAQDVSEAFKIRDQAVCEALTHRRTETVERHMKGNNKGFIRQRLVAALATALQNGREGWFSSSGREEDGDHGFWIPYEDFERLSKVLENSAS